MTVAIILLASWAGAEVGVLPVEDVNKENAPQAIQQALDQTFSVNGGTIAGKVFIASHTEVGGNLVISPVGWGVTFPDGTTQTTAASNFTGGVLTSTLTVAPTLGTVTANHSAIIRGAWSVVGSTRLNAVNGVTFTNILNDATTQYRITANWVQNTTDAKIRIVVNNDTTAGKHVYTNEFNGTATAATLCLMTSFDVASTRESYFIYQFSQGMQAATKHIGYGVGHSFNAGSNIQPFATACQYDNTAVDSIVMQMSAGTMTGIVILEALRP